MSAPRKKLMFAIGSMGGGGAERQILELLKAVDRSVFEPHLFLIHRTGELLPLVPADVVIHSPPVPPSPRGIWGCGWIPGTAFRRRAAYLAGLLAHESIDLLYDRTYLTTLETALATSLRPTPRISAAVADPRVQLELYRKLPRSLSFRYARWAYASAAKVVANSQGLKESLVNYFRLPESHMAVLPNLFDFDDLIRRAGEATIPVPAAAQLPENPFRILTVGRIDPDKGHRFLARAVAELVREGSVHDLVWEIVGTGPSVPELTAEIARLGIGPHVVQYGFCENPMPLYRRADLFCLPSLTEGLPNVLIEALAMGTPVIATDCPSGPREILVDGRYGSLIPLGPGGRLDERGLVANLKDAILQLASSRDGARQQAEEGRTAVFARYSAANGYQQFHELATSLIASD